MSSGTGTKGPLDIEADLEVLRHCFVHFYSSTLSELSHSVRWRHVPLCLPQQGMRLPLLRLPGTPTWPSSMIQIRDILRYQVREVQHFIPINAAPPVLHILLLPGDAVVRKPLVFPNF